MGKSQTTKKVKYVGTELFINMRTGEVDEMAVTSIEERDFNFTKIWMKNFITTLDLVGNQKIKVCLWIIDNINKDNQLIYTYRQIADATGTSLETVRTTMRVLLQANFLRKKNNGCYIVNPDILYKGSRTGRMSVLNQYCDPKTSGKEITPEERLKTLMVSIEKLKAEADKLAKQIEAKNAAKGITA